MPKKKPTTTTARITSLENKNRWLYQRLEHIEKNSLELWRRHSLAVSAGDDQIGEIINRLIEVEDVSNKIMAERLMYGKVLQDVLAGVLKKAGL